MATSMTDPFYYKKIEYVDKKGKKNSRQMSQPRQYLTQKRIYADKTKKIISLFKTKGNVSVNSFNYLNQYCYVKMALILEGIYVSKNVTSLQIKVYEVYIKSSKTREYLLTIKESDDEQSEGEEGNEGDAEKDEQSGDDNIEDLIISDEEVDE